MGRLQSMAQALESDKTKPSLGLNWATVRTAWARAYSTVTTEPWVKPLSVGLGTHIALYILIILFIGLFPGEPDAKPTFWNAMAQWDGEWYMRIATQGYRWRGPTVQSAVVFFPLYPALSKLVGLAVGDLRWGFLIVTNISFVLFLFYLYRLTLLDFDASAAERAITYAAVFPGAFVLASFYTEATTFALTTGAFYYARRGRWSLAILLGLLGGLTRLPAVFILLPIAYEYWRQRGWRWQMLWLTVIPLGTVSFAAYVWRLSGSPWTIVTALNTAWFRSTTPPWETLRLALDRATWPLPNYVVGVGLLDAGTILLFIALTIYALARMPRAYWLYAVPVLLAAISQTVDPDRAPPTASVTRYLMAIFPGYIALGLFARNPYVDQTIRWTFAILMGVFAIYFFSRFWVL